MSHVLVTGRGPELLRRATGSAPLLPVLGVVAVLALPLGHGPGGGSGAGPADAVSALAVLYCAVRLLRTRRRPLSRTAAVVLGLPVAGLALAALHASSPGTALAGLGRYLQVFVLVPAAVVLLIRHRADFRMLARALVALALWQGAVGIDQYATGTGASYQGQYIRAVGTFGPQDVMGMATAVSFGLLCAVGLALGGAGRAERTVATGCAVVLLVPLALSFSRGAWIATAVGCLAQLALAGLRRAVKVVAVVVAAGVVLVGGAGVGTERLQERLGSIGQVADAPDQSVVDRYSLWAAAAGMWREHPLTGVGLKDFPEYRDGYAPLALSSGSDTEGAGAAFRRQPLLSPHNMYLLVLGEQGLIGLLALAGSWLALLVCALRGLHRARAAGASGAAGVSGAGTDCALVSCGLLIWQSTDFVYADIGGPSTVLTAVCLGLAAWWALVGSEGTGSGSASAGEVPAR
ncbi:O-antigen ligase family protein [Streptomyces sp. NPDC047000]|uniref:O-antigen ligase family protein n=1 Tax=Streptomyces sp. NPDC047000 TaxID=3155474 RepID=UPI00340C1B67